MDLELLRQVDYCTSKCGRPVPPPGLSCGYIPRGIPVPVAPTTAAPQQTVVREVIGDTDFELRAISMGVSSTVACYFQAQLPDGRFLFNYPIDISQVAGYGSSRFTFTEPLVCPPGTRFVLTFDISLAAAGSTQPVMVLFEGADRYLLKNGQPARCPEAFASELPRIFGTGNENIMAPSWQQGFSAVPPKGMEFEPFQYCSVPVGQAGNVRITGQPPFNAIALAGPLTATAMIQIDQTNDFCVQRFLIDVQADNTVTAGTILARVRAGSGYSLTDDYVDILQYLGSSPFAKRWDVARGDQIFFDLQLVDGAGTGSMYFRAFADGVRRKAA